MERIKILCLKKISVLLTQMVLERGPINYANFSFNTDFQPRENSRAMEFFTFGARERYRTAFIYRASERFFSHWIDHLIESHQLNLI